MKVESKHSHLYAVKKTLNHSALLARAEARNLCARSERRSAQWVLLLIKPAKEREAGYGGKRLGWHRLSKQGNPDTCAIQCAR